jgi:hypothetical protein
VLDVKSKDNAPVQQGMKVAVLKYGRCGRRAAAALL